MENIVYVLSASEVSVSGYAIQEWVEHDKHNNTLHPEAEEFIKVCKKEGFIYSLEEFQDAFNIEESIGANDWIYITRNS